MGMSEESFWGAVVTVPSHSPAEYNRAWAKENREKRNSAQRRLSRRKRTHVTEYKSSRGCSRCLERDSVCLDLHHLEGKNEKLRHRTKSGSWRSPRWDLLSWAEIEHELAKCDVLCSNCHRKLTHQERLAGTV